MVEANGTSTAAARALPAIVKAVPSGDTVLVMGADSSRGPPPEKLISLTGITAPRLANRSTDDSPWAWASRDFLRRLVIGKPVTFVIEAPASTVPGGPTGGPPREFGTVYFEGLPLQQHIVAAGWARLKGVALQDEVLAPIEAASKEEGRGVWNEASAASSVRSIKWAGSFDAAGLVAAFGRQPQEAIIEHVPSGSFLRALLLPGFEQVTLSLCGTQCPPLKRGEDGVEEAAPFAREARFFVESRLLHRSVQIALQGVDKNGSLLAELREAERQAKAGRLRLWREYVPPQAASELLGRVVEVVSGDTLVVADAANNETRYSLSSIRCPRMGREPEPYAAEAKEALRRRVLCERVRVTPEYHRSFEGQGGGVQERLFAAVLFDKADRNAAEARRLASVSKHGGAEERSAHYDALCDAEEHSMPRGGTGCGADAIAAKKGMHSGAPPKKGAAVTDLSLPASKERAKSFLSNFTRGGKLRGVVQYVLSGSRLKVLLLKDHCLVTLALVGVRCPACARRDSPSSGEPFGDEALAATRGFCLQREVEVEIESVNDKTGNPRGSVFNGTLILPDKRNLSLVLLEAGLASRFGAAADRSVHAADLAKSEGVAKAAGLKVWEDYSEEAAAEEAAANAAAAASEMEPIPDAQKQRVELTLTEIADGAHFYAHVAGDDTVARLHAKLASACAGPPPAMAFEPKVGAVCAARFSQDNEWYRAKVTKRDKGSYTVFFLDYGNCDVVSAERVRPLDPTLAPSVLSAQAVECRLAHLIVDEPSSEDGEEAALLLGDAAWGKTVVARVEDRASGVLLVTLFDAAQSCVNEKLVAAGLARGHVGMWRYGDIEEDDAHEFGFRRPAPAPAPKGNPWKK
ncbi:hypothetical protein EMIHUDRAFT_452958 [Emiliania huxleyi CCMP1516]|uniref:Tudor domain-containing protein n=2 Tax=Emiliania huxleyi TaxID=2903 RepID=A0A0D3ICS7_EMIH1|nr:hypothetical protein EMIHUDRAFT_452958 [Emiliania huxleyi CCMP1516]EOD09062.1 hypothetical protein EMIHUDRAFT_452958 [Emiliania huxleyi CCMP1516]|eukprot:XP_005761491.1 hypothetical protein EMIHUDRAFT_452958 [Emiliania huxleyi CCMP1516]